MVALRERRPSTARRNAGIVRTIVGVRDIWTRSSWLNRRRRPQYLSGSGINNGEVEFGNGAVGAPSASPLSLCCGARRSSSHGNKKSGPGQSTAALHIAVALLKARQRVVTIDNRLLSAELHPLSRQSRCLGPTHRAQLELPVYCCIKLRETMQISENGNSEIPERLAPLDDIDETTLGMRPDRGLDPAQCEAGSAGLFISCPAIEPNRVQRASDCRRRLPVTAAQELGAAHNDEAINTQHLVFLSRRRYIY
ncbi:MAG: division plane positioning ATPase MipZ [Gemmatimonas sp.]